MLAGARVRAEEEEEVHRGGGGGGAYTTICVAVSGRAGGPRSRSYHYDRPPETQSGRGLSVWHATPVVSESRVCGQTVWWAPADGASFYHRTMRPPGRFVWELPPLPRGTRTWVRLYVVSDASCCYFCCYLPSLLLLLLLPPLPAAYPQRRIVAFLARARSPLVFRGRGGRAARRSLATTTFPGVRPEENNYHLRSGMPRRTRPRMPRTAGGPGASGSTEARREWLRRKPAELVATAALSGDWRHVVTQALEDASEAAIDGDQVFGRLQLTIDDDGPTPAKWLSDVCATCSLSAPWNDRLSTLLGTVYDRTVSVQKACPKNSPERDVVKKFAIRLRDLIVVGCISVSGHTDRDAFLEVVSRAFPGRMNHASRADWTEVDKDRFAAMNHSYHQVTLGADGSFESKCENGRLRPPRVQRPIAEAADGPLSRRGRDPEEGEGHGSTQQATGVAESARQEGAAEDTPAPRDRAAELSPVTQQTRVGIDDKVARRRSDHVAELTRQLKRKAEENARLESRLKCEEADRRVLETLIIAIAYGGGAEGFLHQQGAHEQAVSDQLRSISGEPSDTDVPIDVVQLDDEGCYWSPHSPPQLAAPQMMMYQGPCPDVIAKARCGICVSPSAARHWLAGHGLGGGGTGEAPASSSAAAERAFGTFASPPAPRVGAAGPGAAAAPSAGARPLASGTAAVPPTPGLPVPPAAPRRAAAEAEGGGAEAVPPSTEAGEAAGEDAAAARSEARPGADVKTLTSMAAGLLEMARTGLSAKPGEDDTSRTCDGAIYHHRGHPDVMTRRLAKDAPPVVVVGSLAREGLPDDDARRVGHGAPRGQEDASSRRSPPAADAAPGAVGYHSASHFWTDGWSWPGHLLLWEP